MQIKDVKRSIHIFCSMWNHFIISYNKAQDVHVKYYSINSHYVLTGLIDHYAKRVANV
jgi:hypothetical protein